MKKLLFLSLGVLLLLWGCGEKSSDPGASTKNQIPAQEYTASLTVTDTPDYFIPQSRLESGYYFGQAGSKLVNWSPAKQKTDQIVKRAWCGEISPDGKKVAYLDEKGISLLDLSTEKTALIASPDNQMASSPAIGLWSPDSDKILYMYQYEWSSDYYIYDLAKHRSEPLNIQEETIKFLSRPVAWQNDRIFFIAAANKSLSGKQEYRESGYRSNLFTTDITGGSAVQLTNLPDGCYAEFAGLTKDGEKALITVRDGDNNLRAGILNIDGKDLEYLTGDAGNVVGSSISPDGRFVLLIAKAAGGSNVIKVMQLPEKKTILSKTIPENEISQRFIWDTNSRAVHFGQKSENSGDYKFYTVEIKEI